MRGFGRTGDRTRPGKARQSTVGRAAGRDNSPRRSTKRRERWLEATIKVAHGQADEKGSFVWSFRTIMPRMLYFKCVLLRMTVRKADDDRSIVVVMGLARSESACDLVFFCMCEVIRSIDAADTDTRVWRYCYGSAGSTVKLCRSCDRCARAR